MGVALDVPCVGLSLATLATPVGWIGLAAFAGGATLLLADGAAYASVASLGRTGVGSASGVARRNWAAMRAINSATLNGLTR